MPNNTINTKFKQNLTADKADQVLDSATYDAPRSKPAKSKPHYNQNKTKNRNPRTHNAQLLIGFNLRPKLIVLKDLELDTYNLIKLSSENHFVQAFAMLIISHLSDLQKVERGLKTWPLISVSHQNITIKVPKPDVSDLSFIMDKELAKTKYPIITPINPVTGEVVIEKGELHRYINNYLYLLQSYIELNCYPVSQFNIQVTNTNNAIFVHSKNGENVEFKCISHGDFKFDPRLLVKTKTNIEGLYYKTPIEHFIQSMTKFWEYQCRCLTGLDIPTFWRNVLKESSSPWQ